MFIAFYKMTGPDVIEGFHSTYGIQLMQEHVNELFQVQNALFIKYFIFILFKLRIYYCKVIALAYFVAAMHFTKEVFLED